MTFQVQTFGLLDLTNYGTMQEHHPTHLSEAFPIPYLSSLDLSFHFFYGHFLSSSQALGSILLFACSG